jgi:hypothetical protein
MPGGAAADAGASRRGDAGAPGQPDAKPPKPDSGSDGRGMAAAAPPLKTRPGDPQCGLGISDIALYQGVKVPLVRDGVEVKQHGSDVIQKRRALVRVFLRPESGWTSAKVEGTLEIGERNQRRSFVERRTIAAASNDADLDSTLNFDVPAEQLGEGVTYSFAVTAPERCAGLRFPASGAAELETRRVGTLRVKLVPIKFGADGSDRLPDTGEEQLARFRSRLLAMFPVEAVELSVRQPVRTTIAVTGEPGGWNALLDSMRDLRAEDRPPADVYYFGLIAPARTLEDYCPGDCYLGLSFRTDLPSAEYQSGVGVGFSGDHAASVLAHEMGHLTGRKHAPCKVNTYIDPQYPQADGKTGSWGWDERTRTLHAPDTTRDLMGYCNPAWISDYTYAAITDRLARVNGGERKAASLDGSTWRVLLASGGGAARWGVAAPVVGAPAGAPEEAAVVDEAGAVLQTVEVWRSDLGEGGWSLLVPPAQPGWAAIQVVGASPLRFDAPVVPAFER